MNNLRWKLVLVVAVTVVFGAVGVYPMIAARFGITKPKFLLDQAIKLGLDLKGGVHLVLRVQTDDALKLETDTTVERLRDTLTRGGVAFTKLETTSPTEFVVEGIQNDQAFRQTAVDPDAAFNRGSGAGRYTYTMKPNIA